MKMVFNFTKPGEFELRDVYFEDENISVKDYNISDNIVEIDSELTSGSIRGIGKLSQQYYTSFSDLVKESTGKVIEVHLIIKDKESKSHHYVGYFNIDKYYKVSLIGNEFGFAGITWAYWIG